MGQKIRGFVAQGMNGRRRRNSARLSKVIDSQTPGAFSYTADHNGFAEVFAWGGGGSGRSSSGGGGDGAASGAAIYRRVPVRKGGRVSGNIGAGGPGATLANGNAGGDTTVVFPDGQEAVARGGGGGIISGAIPGVPRTTGDTRGVVGNPAGGGTAGGAATSVASIVSGVDPPSLSAGQASRGSNGNTSGSSQDGGPGRLLIYFNRID